MKYKKPWKVILPVCVLALLAVAAVIYAKTRPVAQLQSPNGEIQLSVYREDADLFTWEYSKGPDWAFSGWSIGGVTDFAMGTFSPDSRHGVLIFTDAFGKEQYHWTDYDQCRSGGINLESACRSEDTFAQAVRQEKGPWTNFSYKFLDWHGSENRMLFRYNFTTIDGTEYSGHLWFDLDAYLQKDVVLLWEITD